MLLPTILPLFPLPNVVLFPHVLLPLHIFEPRYRQLVKDISMGDGLIGMILLRDPENEATRDEPDTYSVGCAGRLVRQVPLPDGRSNILLRGVREFWPREQAFDRPYRTAAVEWMPPPPLSFRLDQRQRRRLDGLLRAFIRRDLDLEIRILDDPAVGDELLVNLFAFALDLPVAEKQGLLEIPDVAARAERLIETLEFHALEKGCLPGNEATKSRCQ